MLALLHFVLVFANFVLLLLLVSARVSHAFEAIMLSSSLYLYMCYETQYTSGNTVGYAPRCAHELTRLWTRVDRHEAALC